MIRRLTYHCFWNFYDYLGTYLLSGAVHTLAVLGLLAIGESILIGAVSGVAKWSIVLVLVLAVIFATAWLAAGLLGFSEKVAYDTPARYGDIREGMRSHTKAVSKVAAFVAVAMLVLGVNIAFYFRVASNNPGSGLGVAAMITAMALVWGGVCLGLLLFPLLATAGSRDVPSSLRAIARRALIIFTLAPGVWVAVAVVSALLLVLGLATRVGLIFVLPAVACFSQTAHRLVVQYADNLAEAQKVLPAGANLRSHKAKARELGWEWEYRQPRRTIRELIKPWEH